MISIKSKHEIEKMKVAGKIVAGVFDLMQKNILPGITTKELDRIATSYIIRSGASPSFKGQPSYIDGSLFPAALCTSVNNEVIHGIPGDRVLEEGDIISIDVGACYEGYHADAARTYPVGKCSEEALKLIQVTKECFYAGLEFVKVNNRIADISGAIQDYVESRGYSVVRDFTGHGIGRELHESPEVPNYRTGFKGYRLQSGMAIAIEPMINIGTYKVRPLSNNWTIVTDDGALSAHYENTVILTNEGPILTTIER